MELSFFQPTIYVFPEISRFCHRRPNGLRYPRLGRVCIFFGSRNKLEARKCLKTLENPQPEVQAGLAQRSLVLKVGIHNKAAQVTVR